MKGDQESRVLSHGPAVNRQAVGTTIHLPCSLMLILSGDQDSECDPGLEISVQDRKTRKVD